MTIAPLAPISTFLPDVPTAAPDGSTSRGSGFDFSGLVSAYRAAAKSLETASHSEGDFASGTGDLATMIFERSRADAALSVAAALSTKTVAVMQTFANMQI